jgi:putative flippase GtrA
VTLMLRHWLKFNAVGVIGVGVQLLVLTFLKSGLQLNYLLATFLAVEAAILHNFVWHQRWTWSERQGNRSRILRRLIRFNFTNGLISLAGNMTVMWFLVSRFRLHYLLANMIAIIVCSLVNFIVSDRFVFQDSAHENRCG